MKKLLKLLRSLLGGCDCPEPKFSIELMLEQEEITMYYVVGGEIKEQKCVELFGKRYERHLKEKVPWHEIHYLTTDLTQYDICIAHNDNNSISFVTYQQVLPMQLSHTPEDAKNKYNEKQIENMIE